MTNKANKRHLQTRIRRNLLPGLPLVAMAMLLPEAALAESAAAAGPVHHRTKFSVSLGFLPLGSANFDYDIDRGKYSVKGAGKSGGLVDVFTSGYGSFASSGKVSGSTIKVRNHHARVKDRRKSGVLKMTFDDQGVTSVYQKPDKRTKRMDPKKYIVVQPEQLKHVTDPASAIIIAVDPADALNGAKVCNRTIPIYDGETRYNMKLSYKATKSIETAGYSGPALVCNMRYVPIAGHKKKHRSVQYMSKNRNIDLWFAPMEGSGYLSPVRIEVGTWLGTFVAKADYFGKM